MFSFFKIMLMWFQLFAQTGNLYITILVQRIFPRNQEMETLILLDFCMCDIRDILDESDYCM